MTALRDVDFEESGLVVTIDHFLGAVARVRKTKERIA
jgi:hypothetical protein